ncbi:MAG: GGDEF domain-containing protein [Nocardiopsaceae bacterium]|nr:GGDEF domain-containing protein [Nocardiopsaceae bacterium]
MAFPDFHAVFGRHLVDSLVSGFSVGVAIGDVDDLKSYVEDSNEGDPECFGHLAGNALMARCGAVGTTWFRKQLFSAGCMSTFGGDEIIIAAAVMNSAKFKPTIVTLRDRCRQWLPRTVSFGIAVVTPDTPGLSEHLHAPLRIANLVLAGVDRALFTHKSARRRNEGEEGFVVDIDLDLRTVGHVIS